MLVPLRIGKDPILFRIYILVDASKVVIAHGSAEICESPLEKINASGMTRMTGPDCAVKCNIINKYKPTYIHTYIHIQGTLSLSKSCTSRESVSPLSRLIRGFRNKYH